MNMLKGALTGIIESQIFYPEKPLAGTPAVWNLAFQNVSLKSGPVLLHGWFLPGEGPAKALLVFFHGNAGNISHRLENLALLHRQGIAVFIFDYRGYGQSGGRPSEQGLYEDAAAALAWGRQKAAELGAPLAAFGRSLGGVAAVAACAENPCDGMILESTFTNLGAMAKRHFPLPGAEKWLDGRFDSLSRIGRIACPKLFFHGDRDGIVPYSLGRQLFEAASEPKEFVTIKGAGHNDTYVVGGEAYFRKIGGFLEELA